MKRRKRRTRTAFSLLAFFLLIAASSLFQACSGNSVVSTGVGIHRNSNGDWGHSISVGIHSHGRR